MSGPWDDVPARVVAAAAAWLPAQRRDWGRAMTAELAQVHGLADRWRFAAGALRVALFVPSGRGRRVLAVALAGLLASAAVTAAAAAEIPDLATSAAVLGLLLGGYATFRASRPRLPRRTAPGVMVAVLALVAVAAAVVSVARIAVAHPAAAADSSHVFAVLFAVALAGYLAVALTASSRGQATAAERQAQRHALWWGLAAALASAAVWTVIDLIARVQSVGITGYLWPVGAAAVLAASAGAAAVTGSTQAGARAGLLTAVLTAPMHFAADLTALVQAGSPVVTDAAGDPFEALGDPNRRDILRLLSAGDKPVRDIAAALPISRPAVSRHLRLLKEAGLVAEQAQGTSRIYHLREEGLHAVQEYLERVWGDAARRFRLLAENTENTENADNTENTANTANTVSPE